jgi:ABC-type Fe3+/spermidine/putrescine transport system ATPase subunit
MTPHQSKVILQARDLTRCYGEVWAVRGVSFEVYEGEILVLLGPSGCGKSTTLRILAGLERPQGGEISLKGKTIVDVLKGISLPTEKRNMGMVFQSFAVWPHMTVADHIAFPLLVRHYPRAEIPAKVQKALAFVNLSGMENRLATQLSGGQQQRLSLARALVYEPDILLLDEPLSNLDAKLRHQMRVELKKLQQKLGTTFIFVTHDQVEAMSLAHRVALIKDGQIEQIGTPEKLYENPSTAFVHSFLGNTVTFEGRWVNQAEDCFVEIADGFRIKPSVPAATGAYDKGVDKVLITIRPEDLELICQDRLPYDNEIIAELESVSNLGDGCETSLRGCGTEFVLHSRQRLRLRDGERVLLRINPEKVRIWPKR